MIITARLYAHDNASSYLAFVTHMDKLYEHRKENPDENINGVERSIGTGD